jgi:hypothetical protein
MAKIIQTEKTDNGTSYRIDFGDGMVLWFDTWETEDGLTGDWNQYIFHTNNERDMEVKAFQEASNDEVGAYNYMAALETIEEYIANNK